MSSGYELHQKLRTKTVRQVKKKQYDEAIVTLHQGALDLLKQNEQGSGCDLALEMIKIYGLKSQEVDAESRDRVTDVLAAAAPDFWRKKVIDAAIKWTVNAFHVTTGDPLLRLFIGKMLAKEGEHEASEPHFTAACLPASTTYALESAPVQFADMMTQWLQAHAVKITQIPGETRDAAALERIEAGRFALRGTFPLLANSCVTEGHAFLKKYVQNIVTKHKSLLLPVQPNPRPYVAPGASTPSTSSPALYIVANFELNWVQMATALVTEAYKVTGPPSPTRKPCPDIYKRAWSELVQMYQKEAEVPDQTVVASVPYIGKAIFDIQPPRAQSNMLSDMMASMFGGGANENEKPVARAPIKSAGPPAIPAPPVATSTAPAASQADDLVDDEMD